jgi:hypothetical protein
MDAVLAVVIASLLVAGAVWGDWTQVVTTVGAMTATFAFIRLRDKRHSA